jgi:hypothetical protein
MHGIVYDETRDEFTVTQQFAQAILTFRGGANGEEAPIRIIQGSNTQLEQPDRLALDTIHGELFVPEDTHGKILVFARGGNGNVAPIRVLNSPRGNTVAVDPVNDLLIVVGSNEFRIFNRTDQGDAKPKAVIGGPNSGFHGLGGPFTVYPPKGWIIATVRGGDGELASDRAYVGVWSIRDNGDVPPRWRFGGPNGILRMPRGVVLDPANKSAIVSDKRLNAVLTFHVPELF